MSAENSNTMLIPAAIEACKALDLLVKQHITENPGTPMERNIFIHDKTTRGVMNITGLILSALVDRLQNQWLIWSNEHGMYWCPRSQGYTSDIKEAGRYPIAEARAICENAGTMKVRGRHIPKEIITPAPEINQ